MNKNKQKAAFDFLKSIKFRFYNETATFISKFLDGEFDNFTYIDSKIISESLNITPTKATKVLTHLRKNNLIKKSPDKNKYSKLEKEDFEYQCYNFLEFFITKCLVNLKSIFDNEINISFYRKFDPLKGLEFHNNLIKTHNLNTDLYLEIPITSFAAYTPWDKLNDADQKLYDLCIHKLIYLAKHKRFQVIKSRLTRIYKKNLNSIIYFVIFLKRYFQTNITTLLAHNISNETIKQFLFTELKQIESAIKDLSPFFENNNLLVLIDFNRTCFNGPISIIPPYVFRMYYEGASENKIYQLFTYFGERYCNNIIHIYKQFFKNLLVEYSIIDKKAIDTPMIELDLGNQLYNYCLKTIDKIRTRIDNSIISSIF
ncbi:MAG: hypothetical protein ACTSRP_02235 [Candidatus Helarchaeota archaeon]